MGKTRLCNQPKRPQAGVVPTPDEVWLKSKFVHNARQGPVFISTDAGGRKRHTIPVIVEEKESA